MRHTTRRHLPPAILMLLVLSILFYSGCSMINPNSKLNVNRGEYSDEWTAGGVERRASSDGIEHEDNDGLDKWLYSPKYRAIMGNLGVD